MSPDNPCVSGLADFLNMDTDEAQRRIRKSLQRLQEAKDKLATEERQRFTIKTYKSLPVASVIILDANAPECRLQFEIKPYRRPRQYSFGFELSDRDAYLYRLLSRSWLELIEHSETYASTLACPTTAI